MFKDPLSYMWVFLCGAIITSILCFPISTAIGQSDLDPRFTNFDGTVHQIPYDSLLLGYRPYVEDLDTLSKLSWKKVFVRVLETKDPFPDVSLRTEFAIIFKSQMMIPKDGQYEFILASDDGTKLWIDDELVLDNDFVHAMKVARDTINLKRGLYPIKLWYYQAFPSKYGVIFDSRYIGPEKEEISEPIVWDGDILFDFDHYVLSDEGFRMLDDLVTVINSKGIDEITIRGHTDSIGPEDYNYTLSEKRAQAIKDYIEDATKEIQVQLIAIGYGEEQPRVPNTTAANRAKNRRVEFVLR